eukprot:SAG11_NODE_449_length_9392_cov_16.435381_2_plen_72_part_00
MVVSRARGGKCGPRAAAAEVGASVANSNQEIEEKRWRTCSAPISLVMEWSDCTYDQASKNFLASTCSVQRR